MTPDETAAAIKTTLLSQAIEANKVTGSNVGHMTTLLSGDFTVEADPTGRYQLKTKTGVPPDALIKARLFTDMSHFAPSFDLAAAEAAAKELEGINRLRAFGGARPLNHTFVHLGDR